MGSFDPKPSQIMKFNCVDPCKTIAARLTPIGLGESYQPVKEKAASGAAFRCQFEVIAQVRWIAELALRR
jgi:hypothetical protein